MLLTTHSLLTTHYASRTTRHSPLTTHHSPRTHDVTSRYQTRPIFGIVENKLLAHSLLHSLGVPQLP